MYLKKLYLLQIFVLSTYFKKKIAFRRHLKSTDTKLNLTAESSRCLYAFPRFFLSSLSRTPRKHRSNPDDPTYHRGSQGPETGVSKSWPASDKNQKGVKAVSRKSVLWHWLMWTAHSSRHSPEILIVWVENREELHQINLIYCLIKQTASEM